MMIERPIEVSYLWDIREHHAAKEAVLGLKAQRGSWGCALLVATFVIGFGAWMIGTQDKLVERGMGVVTVTLGLLLVAPMSQWVRRVAHRFAFQSAKALSQPDQKFTFVIDGSRVKFISPGAESWCVWELVPLVAEVPTGFLLEDAGRVHWLPRHAFKSEDDESAFADLARHKAAKFRQHAHY